MLDSPNQEIPNLAKEEIQSNVTDRDFENDFDEINDSSTIADTMISGSIPKKEPEDITEHFCLFKLQKYEKNRKTLKVVCPHKDKPHYSKMLCKSCYFKQPRGKKPTNCAHASRGNYAKGLCNQCYHTEYYQNKKSELTY